jgi:hypothetical protein
MRQTILIYVLTFLCSVLFNSSCNSKKQGTLKEENISEEQQIAENDQTANPDTGIWETKSVTAVTKISADTLVGRWLRPDGNYVIQINTIKEDKKVEAQYFNPNPINIARAEIIPDSDLRIFIEFDDRGYEGSSYDLKYDPQNDALIGTYFQATYGQTYQIGFVRIEEQ